MTTISRTWASLALVACLDASTVAAAAPEPFTIAKQGTYASLAKDPRGGFVVTYVLGEVFARRYGPDDRALTAGLPLGAYDYAFPTVGIAATGGGSYRVAWEVAPKYAAGHLAERLLGPRSLPRGPLRNLGMFAAPSLAPVGTDGSYVIAMHGHFADAPPWDVVVQLRGADGRLRRELNLGPGYYPQAASAASGGFWVVWSSQQGLRARQFSNGGVPLGQYLVDGTRHLSVVAGNRRGDLVVAWSDTRGIHARWWTSSGHFGPRISVGALTATEIGRLSAAMDAEGKALLVWGASCCSPGRIEARRFEARGGFAGGVFVVRPRGAIYPVAAAGAAGDFVVAWDQTTGHQAGSVLGQSLPWVSAH